ncbi:MAG: tetratricopeptide repeat protein [Betaproteobacteria bacterium]
MLLALATALLVALPSARADYLDDVEVLHAGDNTVIRINFNVQVQYLRHVPEREGDLVQIFLRVLSNDAAPPITDESWTTPANQFTPRFTVTNQMQTGAQNRRLLVQFASPVRYLVRQGRDSRSIEMVLLPALETAAKKPALPPAAPVMPKPKPQSLAKGKFAIQLDTFPTAEQATRAPIPDDLAGYSAFVTKSSIAELTLFDRNLGYFGTRESAEVVRKRLLNRYPNALVVDTATMTAAAPESAAGLVSKSAVPPPSGIGMAPAAATPAPFSKPSEVAPAGPPGTAVAPASPGKAPQPSAAAPPVSVAAPSSPIAAAGVESQATQLMAAGRAAIQAGKYEDALDAFNQLLILPPNTQSQDAQELIGLAREQIGQIEKAKAEYQLYLKLYPEGAGAQQVRERLAHLQEGPVQAANDTKEREPMRSRVPTRSFYGSVSQYYYDGSTQATTAFNTPTAVGQATLSRHDLSAIITTADLNARFRSEESDTKLVFRDTDRWSLLDTNPSRNRLDAAYFDYRGLQNPLSLRMGRQTGVSGGILGRFDGGIAGYGLTKNWRVNAVAGVPVDYYIDSKRYFYGLNVEAERIADYWSGNAYVINQLVDGIADRSAVGGEVRYFRNGNSLYTLLDYDMLFHKVNIATLQGTVQTKGLTTFTLLLDQRKAPSLATSNAVYGQMTTSVSTLLQTYTQEQLRQQALGITSDVKQVLASVTTPVSKSWQLGADYRLTNVGALPGVTDPVTGIVLPATPGTGNIYGYTLQAIGSNLYSGRDINVLSATYLKAPTYHGAYVSYNNLTGLGPNWTLEPAIRYYTQRDDTDTRINRYTAVLKLSYVWGQHVSLEGEYDFEKTITESALQREDARNQFFYVGYRVTF